MFYECIRCVQFSSKLDSRTGRSLLCFLKCRDPVRGDRIVEAGRRAARGAVRAFGLVPSAFDLFGVCAEELN